MQQQPFANVRLLDKHCINEGILNGDLKVLLGSLLYTLSINDCKYYQMRYYSSLRVCKTAGGQSQRSEKNMTLEDDLIVRELNPGRTRVVRGGPRGRIFFRSPTLTACSFAAL